MRPRRIAVYGGSFNPPTKAHAAVVEALIAHGVYDEIWVSPSYSHPYGKEMAEYDLRFHLCELAFGHLAESRVRVRAIEDVPAARAGFVTPSSMYGCLSHLKSISNDEYSFVIGYDQALDISASKWICSAELVEQFQALVVPRGDDEVSVIRVPWVFNHYTGHLANVVLPPLPEELRNVSSTAARAAIARRDLEAVNSLVDPAVSEAILTYSRIHHQPKARENRTMDAVKIKQGKNGTYLHLNGDSQYDPTEFERPTLTADVAVFRVNDVGSLQVLLITRGADPFAGKLAFPGGYAEIKDGEDITKTAYRELGEETGLTTDGIDLVQFRTYANGQRDPRWYTADVVYYAILSPGQAEKAVVDGGKHDDAASCKWYNVRGVNPEDMAFDHRLILDDLVGHFNSHAWDPDILIKAATEPGETFYPEAVFAAFQSFRPSPEMDCERFDDAFVARYCPEVRYRLTEHGILAAR